MSRHPPPGVPAQRHGPFERSISVAAFVAAAFIVLPLAALAVRAPWRDLTALVVDPTVLDALQVSLVTSLAAAGLAVGLGTPLAWVIARRTFPGRNILRSVVTLPMVLPPVVAGVGLLMAFGRRGLLGGALEVAGLRLPFTTLGAVVAAAFVSMPFYVVTVESGLRIRGQDWEEAAATLGAGPAHRAFRVTLPAVRSSIAAGLALTWARALGEFGATITFAGNLPGETQTMPLAVYVELQTRPGAAVVLSLMLLVVAGLVLIASRRLETWR